jgi:methylmalonyl-CoA mutase
MSAEVPGIDDWRKLVSESLKGRDFDSLRSKARDGIVIEPLYERRNEAQPLWSRGGRRWTIVQAVDDPDPDRANQQAIADIKGGATGLSLHFSSESYAGLPPTQDALRTALDGIDLTAIRLRLEPHLRGLDAATWLKDLILTSGIAPERADIDFGLDRVGVLATGGAAPERGL